MVHQILFGAGSLKTDSKLKDMFAIYSTYFFTLCPSGHEILSKEYQMNITDSKQSENEKFKRIHAMRYS